MAGTSIHTLEKQPDGLYITIHRAHTVQNRFEAACSRISNLYTSHKQYAEDPETYQPLDLNSLKAAAFSEFYYHAKSYISISPAYHEYVQAKINEYIEQLTNALNSDIIIPDVAEPTDFLDSTSFHLPFSDLLFSKSSYSMQERSFNARSSVVKNLLLERLSHFKRDTPYSRKELVKYTSDETLKSGVKFGFLEKAEKYGHYIIKLKGD